jgi:hypothetical protein
MYEGTNFQQHPRRWLLNVDQQAKVQVPERMCLRCPRKSSKY